MEIQRGDIFFASLDPTLGFEQAGTRPVLVVQSDEINPFAPTVTVVPITSNLRAGRFLFAVMLPAKQSGLPQDSVALTFQVRTLDKSRLMRRAGRISPEKMLAIDRALRLHLAL
jgi:mRNA interferase MazF